MVGSIYLSKIYFTDLSNYKIRPVLVIKELDEEDVICLQLSSKDKKDRISISNNNLIDGKIHKDSIIIIPKNFTIHKSTLIKYIGKISDDKLNIVFKTFCKDLGCNK